MLATFLVTISPSSTTALSHTAFRVTHKLHPTTPLITLIFTNEWRCSILEPNHSDWCQNRSSESVFLDRKRFDADSQKVENELWNWQQYRYQKCRNVLNHPHSFLVFMVAFVSFDMLCFFSNKLRNFLYALILDILNQNYCQILSSINVDNTTDVCFGILDKLY